MEEIVKKLAKIGFTFGAVFTSSVVGQMVIPVPVLGFVVGGIVGSIFGSLFGQVVDSANSKPSIKYTALVDKMISTRQDNGAWSFESLGRIKPVLARWFTLVDNKALPDQVWLSMICFLNVSLYASILQANKDKTEAQTEYLEKINRFIEPSVEYFSTRVSLLDHEAKLLKVIETLTVLCKEGFIKIDVKITKKPKN